MQSTAKRPRQHRGFRMQVSIAAFLIGEPADKMLKDPELLAKGVVFAAKRYHADGIPLVFDLSVEANSVGCDLKWWPDNVPSVTNHPLSDKSVAEAGMRLPTKGVDAAPVCMRQTRIAKPQLDEMGCALMGLCGRLTLASHLSGVRIFTDVYKNREKAHDVPSSPVRWGAGPGLWPRWARISSPL